VLFYSYFRDISHPRGVSADPAEGRVIADGLPEAVLGDAEVRRLVVGDAAAEAS
jgi:hypothetical protein